MCLFFFFSSRRRHTRFDCDWSSDVCSSDLTRRCHSRRLRRRKLPLLQRHARPLGRSEEHTSELQSQSNLVCRLLLEKKKKTNKKTRHMHRYTHISEPSSKIIHLPAWTLCKV